MDKPKIHTNTLCVVISSAFFLGLFLWVIVLKYFKITMYRSVKANVKGSASEVTDPSKFVAGFGG